MSAQVLGGEYGIRKGNAQITFPAVFEAVAATHGLQSQYIPTGGARAPNLPVGTDLQAQWHEQKKKDADYMASQKVHSTRMMNKRANVSHQGYYGLPKPSLVQRQFANPSLGAAGNHSARQDQDGPFQLREAGALSGGVLRSTQGQEYAKKALLSRVAQLNAIDENKKNFTSGLPAPALGTLARAASTQRSSEGDIASADVSEKIKVELNQLIRSIDDAMEGAEEGGKPNISRFTYTDATRMLSLIFRIAPRATEDELQGLLGDIDNTLTDLQALADPDNTTLKPQDKAVVASMGELYTNIREYLVKMIGGVNLSPKERLDLSKNLVKSLGFSKLGQVTPRNVVFAQAREDADDEEDNFDDSEEAQPASREDTEHGTTTASAPPDDDDDGGDGAVGVNRMRVRNPRAGLNRDERDTFGYASGSYYPSGGRPSAQYFGEDTGAADISGPGFSAVATSGLAVPGYLARAREGIGALETRPTFLEPGMGYQRGRVREAPAVRAAEASASSGLRRVFDRDTQGFSVSTGPRRPGAAAASASAAAAFGLPRRREPEEYKVDEETGRRDYGRRASVSTARSRSVRSRGLVRSPVAAARRGEEEEESVSAMPSSTTGEREARNAAMAAEYPLPRNASELRAQTRTMADVRALVARMNAAGIPHRVRSSTVAPDIARKNIAKKLKITGRG